MQRAVPGVGPIVHNFVMAVARKTVRDHEPVCMLANLVSKLHSPYGVITSALLWS